MTVKAKKSNKAKYKKGMLKAVNLADKLSARGVRIPGGESRGM